MRPGRLLQISAFEYRHARLFAVVRLLAGVWLLLLAALLCSIGDWWGAVCVPAAGLHLFLAARLGQSI
jgi:hypothetical protein